MSRRGAILCGAAVAAMPRLKAEAAPVPQQLNVLGNQLMLGKDAIRLRGVVIGDLLKPDRPALYPFRVIARDWKANAVRISVHPGYWGANVEACRAKLVDNVRAARAAGLFVVICWHALGFPDSFVFRPPSTWGTRSDAFDTNIERCRAFWREMASLYANDGDVVFELFNEPIRDMRRPDDDYHNWSYLQQLWTFIIKEDIRSRASNVVICSGSRYTYDLRGIARNPVELDNIAYAWHIYPREGRQTPADWDVRLDGVQRLFPVIVTEWGFADVGDPKFRATPQSFADPLMARLDKDHMSWFAYSFSPRSQPCLVLKDWKTPTAFGRYVMNQLARPG
ncbi:glycoside hydrolase family 5 protein [Sphingobium aromaticiconvertens]|uniref:glycoside hydrolase family 5 protein n=1 Tax=Sphingobium aromaticiconvertens TaxID=365341 RepID=UPI0030185878